MMSFSTNTQRISAQDLFTSVPNSFHLDGKHVFDNYGVKDHLPSGYNHLVKFQKKYFSGLSIFAKTCRKLFRIVKTSQDLMFQVLKK